MSDSSPQEPMHTARRILKRAPTQIGLGVLFLISRFPLRVQYSLGKVIGGILFSVLKSRRHTSITNIKLCFPELSDKEQLELAKDAFKETTIGILEAAYIWWNSPSQIIDNTDFHGLELIDDALTHGKGVLLIGAHFPSLEIAGALMGHTIDMDVSYKTQKNEVMDAIILKKRQRHFKHVINRKDMRRFLKSLKQNRAVWYAPDQDYGVSHSVFSNFFGVPAASISATSKILNFNQSKALFLTHQRDEHNRYQITVSAFDQTLPSGSPEQDTQIINNKIEQEILKHPAQYMWLHRRFKSRPEGQPTVY